jgi:hypothetical protein
MAYLAMDREPLAFLEALWPRFGVVPDATIVRSFLTALMAERIWSSDTLLLP